MRLRFLFKYYNIFLRDIQWIIIKFFHEILHFSIKKSYHYEVIFFLVFVCFFNYKKLCFNTQNCALSARNFYVIKGKKQALKCDILSGEIV